MCKRLSMRIFLVFSYSFVVLFAHSKQAFALEPIPDKLVVLTFDDSVKSHFTIVRPILKKYGFGGTFFITEGFDFETNKKDYMTWGQISELHKDGFEIGNHTRDHLGIRDGNAEALEEQLSAIEEQCVKHGIPKPVTFAWPGNATSSQAFAILKRHGMLFARRGGVPEYPYKEGRGFAMQPGLDHPYLLPSAGDARPVWKIDDFVLAADKAKHGKIAILQFHGAPDLAHPWVSSSAANFDAYMKYLAVNKFTVISLRDLAKYVDPNIAPISFEDVINDRKTALERKESRANHRSPSDDKELRYWLANMRAHDYTIWEMSAATGIDAKQLQGDLAELKDQDSSLLPKQDSGLKLLPFPGGRHPRIGFIDGAFRPQRETKVSVFAPWKNGGHVIADTPEAIWWNQTGQRELLYLAHTDVPTIWDRKQIKLKPMEWTRHQDGSLSIRRDLPNGVSFGAEVRSVEGKTLGVRMDLWLKNGTKLPISGLRVQNCVMLKNAPGFTELTIENKRFAAPFAACHDDTGKRWIITGWEHCVRPWGNKNCPCLHADPQFPDCPPSETKRLRGWLSFYEGDDVEAEFARLLKSSVLGGE